MADVTLPPLPGENEDPWFNKRDAFDRAVKQQLEGPLSESRLNAALDGITVYVDAARFPTFATDPTGTINDVCASASGRTIVKVAPGEYLSGATGIVVDGVDPATLAPKDVTLDLTGVRLVRDQPGVNLVTLRGLFAPPVQVTSVTSARVSIDGVDSPVTNLEHSAPHGLVKGDWIKLISDDAIPGARISSSTSFPRMGQFMMVHSVAGNTVTLFGTPARLESYVTNVRSAKCYKGSANLRGGVFDVTDGMLTAANRSAYVVRMEGLISSRVDDVVIARAVGPAVQLRSNLYAKCHADVLWAMNDASEILGYGIQDAGSNFSRITGSASWVRHGYDDKTPDTSAGDNRASLYGSTMFPHVTMDISHSSFTGFSTHHESYMAHFDGCTFSGTKGGVTAFGFRGYGALVSNPVVRGAGTAFSAATEGSSQYVNGETREVVIRGGHVVDATSLFATNIRSGTHPHAGIKDTFRTMDISGTHARGIDRTGTIVNSRVRVGDLDVRLSEAPNGTQFAITNSDLDIAGTVLVDGTDVTSAPSSSYRVVTDSTVAPDVSRVVNTGTLLLRGSSTYFAGFTVPAIEMNNQSVVKFPRSDSFIIDGPTLPVPPFPSSSGFAALLGGYEYVGGTRPHTRSGYREFAVSGHVGASNLWRELLLSPEPHLVGVYMGVYATVGVLGAGAFQGQRLTIVTLNGSLVVNDGVENGTSLGVASIEIPVGGSLQLVFIGTVWKKL